MTITKNGHDKKDLVDKIIAALENQRKTLVSCIQEAQKESLTDENIPLSQFDHRCLEASLLANAQTERKKETDKVIELFKNLKVKEFSNQDCIEASALVELEHVGKSKIFFIGPQGAGITVDYLGQEVEVITPQSPLGEELLEKRINDEVMIDSPKGVQEYLIKDIA